MKTARPYRVHRRYTRTVWQMQARFELAFSRITKKAALGRCYRSELIPGKAKSPKWLVITKTDRCCGGVTRPSLRIAGFQWGYTCFNATAQFIWVTLRTTRGRRQAGTVQRWGPGLTAHSGAR